MPRRHDIDAMRVIAFGLLIVYHVAMVYVSDWGFHLKSSYQAEWLQLPMIALNRWRMPLLFVISGIAIGLCRPERAAWRFLGLRTWRLLLPLAFGMLVIVPIQPYCEGLANGRIATGFGAFLLRYWQLRPWPAGSFTGSEFGVTWNHLWYLAYLWLYTVVLIATLPLLRSRALAGLRAAVARQRTAWFVALPLLLLVGEGLILAPHYPETHALIGDWYLHAVYFTVFIAGYALATDAALWMHLRRLRWATLIAALACLVVVLFPLAIDQLSSDHARTVWNALPWDGIVAVTIRAAYAWLALLAVLGWGSHWLDRPFRWLTYCTAAIYPWYMLHQSLLIPLAFVLIPLRLGPVIEPLLVLAGTVVGCVLLHELLIRRVALLRPLFGLKRERDARKSDATSQTGASTPPTQANTRARS